MLSQASDTKKNKKKQTAASGHQLVTTQGVKYRWQLKSPDQKAINHIAKQHNLSQAVAQTLYSRGLVEDEHIRSYLFTSYEKDVADPTLLKGATVAVERILQAIEKQEKILIFGDYDVDGATSTSLALLALMPLGAKVNYVLPNRKRDGYGISPKFVKKAVENNYQLIVTVDNGIAAHEAAQVAQELNIDLIITDHHLAHDNLPPALAIVDPNQPACTYPFKSLAGVGVIFKLMHLIYQKKKMQLPPKVYELLLLGTVADVVPLTSENRYWVSHGLHVVNKVRSRALAKLIANSGMSKETLSSLDIGFMIAPQINALGRLDDPREAVTFLLSSNDQDVERIGNILKTMNEERKRIERAIFQQVESALFDKEIDLEKENVILAAHSQWPAGVIGLVAGKLMHNYGRPTFLFHHDKKKGIVKGSCRSIPAFDVFQALSECKDLLISFGGHAHAAGLSLRVSDLPVLKNHLEQAVMQRVAPDDLIPKITADAHLDLAEATSKIMRDLAQLEPFGNQNPQPVFIINDVTLVKPPTLLKDKHVKAMIFSEGTIKPIIFFNRPDLFKVLRERGDKPFHVVGHVVKNEWRDATSIELQGLDVACDDLTS